MDGELVIEKLSALRLEGLLNGGDEVSMTLLAAVLAEALRQERPPRQILDALWESLPPDDTWERLAADLDDACDHLERERGG